VGNREEQVTPINVDAHLELLGEMKTRDQAEFRFGGWTSPGSGMTFSIDAVEAGDYAVQLFYSGEEQASGALMMVYTESDTAQMVIDDAHSAISEVLHLSPGEQTLGIELLDAGPGGESFSTLNMMAMHRISGPGDRMLRGHGFELFADDRSIGRFAADGAALEFMRRGGQQDEVVRIEAGARLRIEPFADNPGELAGMEVYVDFERIGSSHSAPFDWEMEAPPGRKFTLNVEFISRGGPQNAARVYLQIE
jgi:hypothetical protein